MTRISLTCWTHPTRRSSSHWWTSCTRRHARNGDPATGSRFGEVEQLNATTYPLTIEKDRSFTFVIDKLDEDETQQQLSGATVLARQNREVVIPEVDAYTYGVMCTNAGTKPAAVELTAENIYDEICKAGSLMDEAGVPETSRVLVVTPEIYRIMKKCKEIVLDPAATQAFQTAEDDLYTEELHNALEEALSQLAAKQADVVRRHYFEGKAISEIAREDGTPRNAAQNREQAAFAALRRNLKLQRWRDEIISTRAWSGTGFGAWNHRGSVEERTVEYLEAWEAKSRVWAAERAQLIKEHYADFEASGYFDRNPEQRPTLQTG